MVETGVLRASDPVFDPGVGAVAGIEEGELAALVSVAKAV